jgi:hypothetical protein
LFILLQLLLERFFGCQIAGRADETDRFMLVIIKYLSFGFDPSDDAAG